MPATAATTKSAAQLAYEADVAQRPLYHDGSPRVGWDRLDAVARWSWERNPTPRDAGVGAPHVDDRDGGLTITRKEWLSRKAAS